MSLSQLYCSILMENSSAKTNDYPFPLFHLVDVLSLRLLIWVSSFESFFSRYWSFLQSQLDFRSSKIWDEKKNQNLESLTRKLSVTQKKDDGSVCREEVGKLMGNLGIFCSPESVEMPESIGSNELSRLFEEEPSLEEVKQAFDVFDVNRDGFIDPSELQRVLCILGLKEGSELGNCVRMIKTVDENGDGRVDFHEFVKLMEKSFG